MLRAELRSVHGDDICVSLKQQLIYCAHEVLFHEQVSSSPNKKGKEHIGLV